MLFFKLFAIEKSMAQLLVMLTPNPVPKQLDSILLKVKPLSKVDAVTLKISTSGVLQQVARATLKSTTRTWNSIAPGLLQGGKVSYSNKTEAAITKFSALSKPTWNVRYLSKSPVSNIF